MTYPNGMVKEWTYDTRDRLNKLRYLGEPITSETVMFEDAFADGDLAGLSVVSGSWTAANGYLAKSAAGPGEIARTHTAANGQLRFDYRFTGSGPANVRLRSHATGYVFLALSTTSITLAKSTGGTRSARHTMVPT
jgi:hypothetical protein